ncbi:MAG: metallophosphoesterase family protein, partial [Anaerolineae bacterium]|nr:metallophosphoesterase family protein [Anaerolineae bacterium]
DLIDGGWDDIAVIDYIRSQNITSVRGNHDSEAFAEETEPWSIEEDTDSDFDDSFSFYQAQYLKSLPFSHHFSWEGLTVYLAHGSPWSDTYHVFPSASEATCNKIFTKTKADIVILGHTHIPMKIRFHDKWIFNPGALSGNRDNLQRTCGILDIPQSKFELFDIDTQQSVELDTVIVAAT